MADTGSFYHQASATGSDVHHINTRPQTPVSDEEDGEDELGSDEDFDEDAIAGGSVSRGKMTFGGNKTDAPCYRPR
jgi:hypothetical protein